MSVFCLESKRLKLLLLLFGLISEAVCAGTVSRVDKTGCAAGGDYCASVTVRSSEVNTDVSTLKNEVNSKETRLSTVENGARAGSQATCNGTYAGYLKYSSGQFSYCNGTSWVNLRSN